MNKMKKLLSTIVVASSVFACSSCSIFDINKAKNSVDNAVSSAIAGAIDGVDKNGHFEADCSYSQNASYKDSGTTYYISYKYEFKTNGNCTATNLADNSAKEYTYKIHDGLIEVSNAEGKSSYYYYFGNFFVEISTLLDGVFFATRDGVAVSQQSTNTVGYVFLIGIAQNDLPAVLTGKQGSKGYYYAIRGNGTKGSKYYVNADQVQNFDSSEEGTKLWDVTVKNTTYKAIVSVSSLLYSN